VEEDIVNFTYILNKGENHVTINYGYPSSSTVYINNDQFSLKGDISDLIDNIVNVIEEPDTKNEILEEDINIGVSNDEIQLGFDDEVGQENKNKEILWLEIENFRKMFGDDKIVENRLESLNEEIIEINFLVTDFLDKNVAMSWNIRYEYVITLRITFNLHYYLENLKPPDIEVYQFVEDSKKYSGGILKQLRGILKGFIEYQWPSKSGKKFEAQRFESGKKYIYDEEEILIEEDDKESNNEVLENEEYIVNLSKLDSLGFPDDISFIALQLTSNDLNSAINLLIENDPKLSEYNKNIIKEIPKKKIEEKKI